MFDDRLVTLCADDFGITEGVTTAIEDLARAGRLSATSAIVTGPHWNDHGRRLASVRPFIAVGLHFNLTLGSPLGPLPRLAPDGRLPTLGTVVRGALTGAIDPEEIAAEATRQLERFVEIAGGAPDFLDGHQHVHALPRVRDGVLAALHRHGIGHMLVRDPSDSIAAIAARGVAVPKALCISLLTRGFKRAALRSGAMTNLGFSGISNFDRALPYEKELEGFFRRPGPRHLVMCHPGRNDAELVRLDPVTDRREEEYRVLRDADWLPGRIWKPSHSAKSLCKNAL